MAPRRHRQAWAGSALKHRHVLAFTAAALAGAAAVGLGLRRAAGPSRREDGPRHPPPAPTAARRVRQASEVLAATVVVDSTIEHARGNFENPLMYLAPASALATLAAGMDERGRSTPRVMGGASAIAVGLTGLAGHLYNLLKRPGGLSWHNLFYAAPIGAPGSLVLSGCFALLAEEARTGRLVRTERAEGRLHALTAAGGILGTLAEVALLHFRGAYQNPAMYVPIVAMPLAAGSLALAAAVPRRETIALSRILLQSSALAGLAGAGFHVYGVSRNMAGWRNWSQNLFVGPPIPAPLGFSGITLAGLGALELLKDEER